MNATWLKALLGVSLATNTLLLGAAGWVVSTHGGTSALRRAFNLAPARDACAATPPQLGAHHARLPKTENEIMFLGDGHVKCGPWAEHFSIIRNRGVMEDTTDGVLRRLPDVTKSQPRAIFLQVGLFDLMTGISVDRIVGNYEAILEGIRAASPETRVFMASVPPTSPDLQAYSSMAAARHRNDRKWWWEVDAMNQVSRDTHDAIPELNKRLAALAAARSITYVDFYEKLVNAEGALRTEMTNGDGVGLSTEGYAVYASALEPHVAALTPLPTHRSPPGDEPRAPR